MASSSGSSGQNPQNYGESSSSKYKQGTMQNATYKKGEDLTGIKQYVYGKVPVPKEDPNANPMAREWSKDVWEDPDKGNAMIYHCDQMRFQANT